MQSTGSELSSPGHPLSSFTVDEEDLEMLAASLEMGIDPFPPVKKPRPWGKYAIASFMTIMILSWVSKVLMRLVW